MPHPPTGREICGVYHDRVCPPSLPVSAPGILSRTAAFEALARSTTE